MMWPLGPGVALCYLLMLPGIFAAGMIEELAGLLGPKDRDEAS